MLMAIGGADVSNLASCNDFQNNPMMNYIGTSHQDHWLAHKSKHIKLIQCDLGIDVLSALKCLSWDLPIGVGPQEAYDDVVRIALSLVDASAIHDLVPNVMYEVFVDGSDNNKYENDIKTTRAFAAIACDDDSFHYDGAMAGR